MTITPTTEYEPTAQDLADWNAWLDRDSAVHPVALRDEYVSRWDLEACTFPTKLEV